MTSEENQIKYKYNRTLYNNITIEVCADKTRIIMLDASDVMRLLTEDKYRDTLEEITVEILSKELKEYEQKTKDSHIKIQWLKKKNQ